MFEQVFKNIDDVLWKEAGCTTELDYTEQTSWMLFLKYLDDLEQEKAMSAELAGKPYAFIIDKPHRWSSWAAPKKADGSFDHARRCASGATSPSSSTSTSRRRRTSRRPCGC
jgi:type I restriction enzyme M protein